MCGRFAKPKSKKKTQKQFALNAPPMWDDKPEFSPTDRVPIIRKTPRGMVGQLARWDFYTPNFKPLFNTKAETAQHKMWANACNHKRCIIPADGFFEWQVYAMTMPGPRGGKAKNLKRKYFIHRADDAVMALAGIWEDRTAPDGNTVRCCSIMTVAANELMQWIHNTKARMPAILEPEQYDTWCDPNIDQYLQVRNHLKPCPGGLLEASMA